MQPTYLPWSGYFNLISRADVFVFLDDVQYEKQSWQNRNRVIVDGSAHWLTVPIKRGGIDQKIIDVEINDQRDWRNKQYRLLEQSYSKHEHKNLVFSIASEILDKNYFNLVDLNIAIIKKICEIIGINKNILRSSDIQVSGVRTDRIINICSALGCDEYLSPLGAKTYLLKDEFESKSNVILQFQKYAPAPYSQKGVKEFVGYLSVLDVLANIGPSETCSYIKYGSAKSHWHEEMG